MKLLWALRLDAAHAHKAAVLRAFPGVDVCAARGDVWLRGACDGGLVERAMWLLPGERFHLTAKAQLTPWGRQLPVADCPAGPWAPLAQWMRPAVTAPALPATMCAGVRLTLARGGRERPPALLRVRAETFADYINAAPAMRLARLRFAADDVGHVLVRGDPLPALPGAHWSLAGAVATPLGYSWSPQVAPRTIAERLGLEKDALALFSVDATYEVVPAAAWVPLTRSAARITLEGLPT